MYAPCAITALLLFAAREPAQTQPAAEAPELLPAKTVRIDGVNAINALRPTPDGAGVFFTAHVTAINLWALLVSSWPEIGGGIVGLAGLVCGWTICRTLRRRRIPGLPYCRRCGYCLESLPSERCPDCGDERARRRAIIARPAWRRLAPGLVIVATLASTYAGLLIGEGAAGGVAVRLAAVVVGGAR
jgi:hypothetical protein